MHIKREARFTGCSCATLVAAKTKQNNTQQGVASIEVRSRNACAIKLVRRLTSFAGALFIHALTTHSLCALPPSPCTTLLSFLIPSLSIIPQVVGVVFSTPAAKSVALFLVSHCFPQAQAVPLDRTGHVYLAYKMTPQFGGCFFSMKCHLVRRNIRYYFSQHPFLWTVYRTRLNILLGTLMQQAVVVSIPQ